MSKVASSSSASVEAGVENVLARRLLLEELEDTGSEVEEPVTLDL